ncbi:YbhB/YbcL family Raf kinase inhibitor-like protein [Mucilaginibacter sp. UR6-11]|uniref:YbhB/YbcL family Raf kinase inhibitor-like protein n=1 Tax=Mucilaginibacter sp. UR6-11 TaxID=1435644 RepID=UPI001E3F2D9D|nr:YbhB/YbcL family Raf kinase inhibitor-like protein [Mucilaginibacter sp. UR6-11]MCC8427326.1 YbhB/YbcL family Raf kinase inhibitor-like protein [Mucilaginibacter sp. UR6-11]
MKKLVLVFVLLVNTASITFAQQANLPMRLTTPAFPDGGIIPLKYTQASPAGAAVSPALLWSSVPAGTQSFVLWMHDVDLALKKTSEDNLHWLIWNIPGTATSLPEDVPAGAQLADGSYQVSNAVVRYRGPGAAASGPLHHYVFELFALDIKLDEKAGATPLDTKTNIFKLMQGHIIGKAAYAGLFHRPQ